MKNKKGFTLIELLAVIVILGILMLIAIPSVTEYINGSRKNSYVASVQAFADSVRTKVAALDNFKFTDEGVAYFVRVSNKNEESCITLEKGGKSPFGEWIDAYVVVTYNGVGYSYYFTGKDSGGYGVELTNVNDITKDSIKSNANFNIPISGDSINIDGKGYIVGTVTQPNCNGVYIKLTTNALMKSGNFLNGKITEDKVETIEIAKTAKVPAGVKDSWDISAAKDSTVMVWYADKDSNGLYELYIGGENGVLANPNSSQLFLNYENVKSINLKYLDTSKVTDMSSMFNNCISLASLDLSNFDTSKVTNMSSMFENCQSFASLDLSSFNTSNVTDISGMFAACYYLTNLDLSNFDTSKVTNMDALFFLCFKMVSIDISSFDTSNVINMKRMFADCSKLTNIDVSGFNTSNVTNMSSMFAGCSKLTNLDVSQFNTTKVTDMSWMFDSCSSLTGLDIRNATFANVTSYNGMFNSVSNTLVVIVKDTTAKTFIETRRNEAGKTFTVNINQ